MSKRMKTYSVKRNDPFSTGTLIVKATNSKEAYDIACKSIAPWKPNKSGIRVVK